MWSLHYPVHVVESLDTGLARVRSTRCKECGKIGCIARAYRATEQKKTQGNSFRCLITRLQKNRWCLKREILRKKQHSHGE